MRRESRSQRNQERLSIENKKRVSLGEPAFKTIENLNSYQQERSENAEKIGFTDSEPDVYLAESGKILTDFTYYRKQFESLSTANELANQNSSTGTRILSN